MPTTVEEVKQLVQDGFPDAEPDLEEYNERVTGVIYWPEFGQMTPEQRNHLVTERVRNHLGYRGLDAVPTVAD
jgi:hypothetical protein